MVLGPKPKNRKCTSTRVDYLIHLEEIKPWPPSQSLRTVRSSLIQWEHGDKNFGSTNPVVPLLGSVSGVGDGKIEFNQSFRLPVTLFRDGLGDTGFQKNCIVFNLYEPRRDKTVKGQLLGTAIVDLADYGIVKKILSISAPMNCKRAFSNAVQPLLFLKIQPVDKSGSESISPLMNGIDYVEENEVASVTDDDDDVSSHSSIDVSYSTVESNEGSPPNKEVLSTSSTTSKEEVVKSDGKPSSDFCDQSVIAVSIESQNDLGIEDTSCYIEDESLNRFTQDDTTEKVSSGNYEPPVSRENLGEIGYILNRERLKHAKSVRSPMELIRSNGSNNGARRGVEEKQNVFLERKLGQLESKIKMMEGELREAAAIEVSIYSVVAEHGSSTNKVHAPARRLSRLYLHACKERSTSTRASAARSAVSGLVLVAKACGNDIPRLTFWLSNSVVLRAIILEAFEEQKLPRSAESLLERETKKSSLLKWKESPARKETIKPLHGSLNEWEHPHKFTSSLEKIESWIFSRIVESIWWQAFTPYMQSYERESSSVDVREQANFSLELWKKAFRDACERVCTVRAAGHGCGCLPILSRLIMEQCVARLDAAMFNAILRASGEEIPTDPVSDPISDAKVLPIPQGKSSFGAGAQLKNSIGNWSRWLTDLSGHGDDDDSEDNKRKEYDTFFKSFHHLNSLSDLMMLPKDMLLNRSIRNEVCPTFGAPLIKRILDNFVPDEFSPDPIPDALLQTLHSEEPLETHEDTITNFPCCAAPIVYLPPSGDLLRQIVGNSGSQSQLRRSGSSIIRKSYTSDDELDDLDSPLTSIIGISRPRKSSWSSGENGRLSARRYQLLREVWINSA